MGYRMMEKYKSFFLILQNNDNLYRNLELNIFSETFGDRLLG